jgi:hypothetical protein
MPSGPDARLVWGLAAALLIGALVGIEREKNKTESGDVGIGGVRTFILFALSGATAAWLSERLASPWVFVVALIGVAAMAVAGYLAQARVKPRSLGLTTEIASVFVYLLGGACVVGYVEVALALGVAASAILAYKQPLHDLVASLGTEDIEAGVKLLVATFIVLPLLPREAVDPWGAIEPHTVWLLVILIAGLSLVGYVATRALGPERGAAVTGLAGGLVSSTAVTLAFARQSREARRPAPPAPGRDGRGHPDTVGGLHGPCPEAAEDACGPHPVAKPLSASPPRSSSPSSSRSFSSS